MPIDNHQDYLGHAKICIELAGSVGDRKARSKLREMAAAWLKLAEAEAEAEPQSQSQSQSQGNGASPGA